jgi:NADH dehydrogenase (ubiquinone) 1 alpha subcomplex subunit 6
VDTSSRYTDTGGSGLDATALSASPEHQAAEVRALYRTALREIPSIRVNYTIVEDESFVGALIRDLFTVKRDVSDPKIVDMLIFKAKQELGEIRSQFKGRHQVGVYFRNYHDKLAQQAAARLSAAAAAEHEESDSGGAAVSEDAKQTMLASWRQRGLVPADIVTWAQYEHWKADEDEKHAHFAVDANFFSPETLQVNSRARSQCSVM